MQKWGGKNPVCKQVVKQPNIHFIRTELRYIKDFLLAGRGGSWWCSWCSVCKLIVLAVTSWTWALSEMLGKKVALLLSFAMNDSLIILKWKIWWNVKYVPSWNGKIVKNQENAHEFSSRCCVELSPLSSRLIEIEREECQEVKPWRLPLSWSSAVLQDDEKEIIVNKLKLPFLPESSLAFLMPVARYRMTLANCPCPLCLQCHCGTSQKSNWSIPVCRGCGEKITCCLRWISANKGLHILFLGVPVAYSWELREGHYEALSKVVEFGQEKAPGFAWDVREFFYPLQLNSTISLNQKLAILSSRKTDWNHRLHKVIWRYMKE